MPGSNHLLYPRSPYLHSLRRRLPTAAGTIRVAAVAWCFAAPSYAQATASVSPAAVVAPAASTVQARPPIGKPGHYAIGTPATESQIASWNTDIAPDGKNLPAGEGHIEAGRQLYASQCLACHGAHGEGGLGDRLVGGIGSLASAKPIRTVGSYWPYATTLFDYIRRAMPLNAPKTLTNEEVYSVTGYVLSLNGLTPDHGTFGAAELLKVKMPNRNGFVDDPRPDVGPLSKHAPLLATPGR
jgi:mono/diheme cytochrome c family protein